MRSIQGKLNNDDLELVNRAVTLMFENSNVFKTPEALVIYENQMLDEDTLLELVEQEYGFDIYTPPVSYVPDNIVEFFRDYNVIPIKVDNVAEQIHLAVIPEQMPEYLPSYKGLKNELIPVPIYYFIELYTEHFGRPSFLKKLPPKDIFEFIVSEAVHLGAADITVSARPNGSEVYYNVKKRRVESKRKISLEDATDICKLIASQASMTLDKPDKYPIYPSVDLDKHHRGRVVIGYNYHGVYLTARVLPNTLFDTTLEELNLSKNTINFIRNVFYSDEKGLRLFIGPTFSGKNTSAMSGLYEKIKGRDRKTVSVEFPVELIVPEIEQMNCETEEEFVQNVASLLRQNPDIAYITEMTDTTASMTMNVANTGKVVVSSLHANSIADAPSRIQDLTGLSMDRIIQNLQSAVYQELVPTPDGGIKPITTCLHFTQELKDSLIGKSLGEITKILRGVENSWVS